MLLFLSSSGLINSARQGTIPNKCCIIVIIFLLVCFGHNTCLKTFRVIYYQATSLRSSYLKNNRSLLSEKTGTGNTDIGIG